MASKFLELERLKTNLRNKGFDDVLIGRLVAKAEAEIDAATEELMSSAMEQAIEAGVNKESAEFINELRPSPDAFVLETSSGNTDFSTPPYPNLTNLLRGAKPMKDGSGVYKVIPVGKSGNKQSIASNIFDAQKSISAERLEAAKKQYAKVVPQGGANQFRTATSKQDINSQWVMPSQEKDFTEDLTEINKTLQNDLESKISEIIREYEENF